MAIRDTERNAAAAVLSAPAVRQGIKSILIDPDRSESVTFDGLRRAVREDTRHSLR